MTYQVTFKITTVQPYGDDKVAKVTRKYPQYLGGRPMDHWMFIALMLAEYPDSNVSIVDIK